MAQCPGCVLEYSEEFPSVNLMDCTCEMCAYCAVICICLGYCVFCGTQNCHYMKFSLESQIWSIEQIMDAQARFRLQYQQIHGGNPPNLLDRLQN